MENSSTGFSLEVNQKFSFFSKEYVFKSKLGRGSFGQAILILDTEIDQLFVCKKYSPEDGIDALSYYNRFVQEIKLLHWLNHKNIVRVFNYYLYPAHHSGFIILEHVDGLTIKDYIQNNPGKIDDVFIQTITGFRYLEDEKILHRDIRETNILVSHSGIVKIIDFGFGKSARQAYPETKSISINWIGQYRPKEFADDIYDVRTEVYFVGCLFKSIYADLGLGDFRYSHIVDMMIEYDPAKRLGSFSEVEIKIREESQDGIALSRLDQETYQLFADNLEGIIGRISDGSVYRRDSEEISRLLDKIERESHLERFVRKYQDIAICFLQGEFIVNLKREFDVSILIRFAAMFRSASKYERDIILNHLWRRLDDIERYWPEDLPF